MPNDRGPESDPTPAAPTSEEVADQLETLAAAHAWLLAEQRLIASGGVRLSQVLVDRLVALGNRMRPAAQIRARLRQVDPELLLAGMAVWLRRHPPITAGRDRPVRAADRAERAWSGGDAA